MTLQAYPVRLEQGIVYTTDGSPLPQHAYAVLVVMPELGSMESSATWETPFHQFLETVKGVTAVGLDAISDEELNALIHEAR